MINTTASTPAGPEPFIDLLTPLSLQEEFIGLFAREPRLLESFRVPDVYAARRPGRLGGLAMIFGAVCMAAHPGPMPLYVRPVDIRYAHLRDDDRVLLDKGRACAARKAHGYWL